MLFAGDVVPTKMCVPSLSLGEMPLQSIASGPVPHGPASVTPRKAVSPPANPSLTTIA